ncbi:hypothetical protein B0J14DRAFT_314175 [Halenospora varia]|nr:hypothetical protein B0J14DRAFT_314175 [Halenospora varia]
MASPLMLRSPQCISCLRRTAGSLGERRLFPSGQQIRGKKKLRKAPNRVNVLLKEDVKFFGKKGAVISVTPGVMRNQFFPNKKAEYVTAARLKELGLKKDDIIDPKTLEHPEEILTKEAAKEEAVQAGAADAEAEVLQGDGIPAVESLEPIETPKGPDPVETFEPLEFTPAKPGERVGLVLPTKRVEPVTPRVDPEVAITIISDLLPPTLEFFRTPIRKPEVAPVVLSPSLSSKAAITGKPRDTRTETRGAVSTQDIITSIKTILATNGEGSKISLHPEDIHFLDKTVEKGRVKYVGDFEIDIHLKGAPDAIRRTIKVIAQERA